LENFVRLQTGLDNRAASRRTGTRLKRRSDQRLKRELRKKRTHGGRKEVNWPPSLRRLVLTPVFYPPQRGLLRDRQRLFLVITTLGKGNGKGGRGSSKRKGQRRAHSAHRHATHKGTMDSLSPRCPPRVPKNNITPLPRSDTVGSNPTLYRLSPFQLSKRVWQGSHQSSLAAQ